MKETIRQGILPLPSRSNMLEVLGVSATYTLDKMWNALWNTYLKDKGSISLPYWSKKFNDARNFNIVLSKLSKAGWLICETLPHRNWGEARINEAKLLQFVSMEELAHIRAYKKFEQYKLKLEPEATLNTLTSYNGRLSEEGPTREGFRKAGNTKFQFDVQAMQDYYDVIIAETTKSMRKIRMEFPDMTRDSASYDEVSKTIIDAIIQENGTYSSGQNKLDTRRRNIHGMLNKVFNPVSFKVARACLIIPEEYRRTATEKGLINKYLFIAELLGFKKGTVENKIEMGRQAYYEHRLLNLDPTTEKGQKDFYENIWLHRTYQDIDNYFGPGIEYRKKALLEGKSVELNPVENYKWQVPIEIDMSASVLGYVGLLTNHKPFLERCNMLGHELTDAWEIKGIAKRNQAKVIMRTIYGSAQSCRDMWTDDGIKYTQEDVVAYEKALTDGELAVGDRFSKFIIRNCNPRESMVLNVRGEHFRVECNRYKHIGETMTRFDLYNTEDNTIKRIHHMETRKVADLEQFRRFFVTGLIHNLDSQVEDTTTEAVYDACEWVIDIHDALILCAEMADYARKVYAGELEDIHTNRNTILTDYFESIGITSSALKEWKEVKDSVELLLEDFECSPMVLK